MAAHRDGGRTGDLFTAHEGRKKRCDSEGTGATAILQRVLLLAAAVSFFFSASSANEVANAATQKTPAARKHSVDGRFSRRGRKPKKVILCLQAK